MNRYASPELLLQVVEQVEHLCLHRQVERGDRLVADDHVGVERERAGDPEALTLAAGELLRILPGVAGPQPDEIQQLAHPRRPLREVLWRPVWVRHGSLTMSPADILALSEANGSWNTICTAAPERQQLGAPVVDGSTPSKRTEPPSGVSSMSSVRASVDLPQPDSPTRPSVSPRCRSRVTPSSARSSVRFPAWRTGKILVRSRTSRSGRVSSSVHLVREVAGGQVAGGDLAGRGPLLAAPVARDRAASW